jgi:hypothetical protein
MTTKTVEELSVELGKVIAYGEVIDLILADIRSVGSIHGRLDHINEYGEQQAVLEALQNLRKDVMEMSRKVSTE